MCIYLFLTHSRIIINSWSGGHELGSLDVWQGPASILGFDERAQVDVRWNRENTSSRTDNGQAARMT